MKLARSKQHWRCPTPPHEPLVRSIINGLFAEGLIPAGSIIDAGANDGVEACVYAERQPHRIVHAVEPLLNNTFHISRLAEYVAASNLQILRAGLGNETRRVSLSSSRRMVRVSDFATHAKASTATETFQVYRIDDLFSKQWSNQTLGFLHLDVEGIELDVIRGGMQTIQRDLPVLTVEVFVHNRANTTYDLLAALARLRYRTFIVEEQCGIPADCRNVLCLPISRIKSMRQSATLDLAHVSSVLQEVTPITVASAAYAEVCHHGGKCCPHGPSFARKWPCCSARCVQQWLSSLKGARETRRYGVFSWSEFEGVPHHGRVFV